MAEVTAVEALGEPPATTHHTYRKEDRAACGSTYSVRAIHYSPWLSVALSVTLTLETARVTVDPSIPEDGDQVTLRGNLEELGGGGPGVPMVRSEDDPSVWSVEVELPIGMTETHFTGMFDYRFAIETARGAVIEEGAVAKSAKAMYTHFYHNCRTNYHQPRLKQSNMIANDDAFVRLMRREILQLDIGAISLRDCLLRVQGIKEGLVGVVRSDVEELFDQLLKDAGKDGRLSAPVLLVLTAAVGMFELSSTERTWVATAPRRTTNAYGATTYGGTYGGGGYYAAKPIPKPDAWCAAVCQTLDVLDLLRTDLKAGLTIAGKGWFVAGLTEAAERLSTHGRFEWVRVMPVILDNQGAPNTDVDTTATNAKAIAKNFRATAELIFRDIDTILSEGERLTIHAQLAAQQEDYNERDKEARADTLRQADEAVALGRRWLHALIQFSPDMNEFEFVVTTRTATAHLHAIGHALQEKTATYRFLNGKEVAALMKVAQSSPAMIEMGPALAAGLLNNEAADTFVGPVLDFVRATTERLVLDASSGPETDSADQVIDDKTARDAIELLTNAAKSWIRRRHAEPPEREATNTGYGWSQPALPTQAELAKERWQGIIAAMDDVADLLAVPALAANGKRMIFELTRCYMFKGELTKILDGCCEAAENRDPDSRPVALKQFLFEKAESTVREIVSQALDSEYEILRCLHTILHKLTKGSELSHTLLVELAATMSIPTRVHRDQPPALDSVLRRQPVWQELLRGVGGDWRELSADTPLGQMLHGVERTLATTADSLRKGSISLKALHTVIDHEIAFVEFCADVDITSAQQETVDTMKHALTSFDAMLEQTQCYVSVFCAQVKIDTTELRSLIDRLRADYDKTPLYQILDAFEDVHCAGSIPWMHCLSSSELFLAMWRATGAAVRREHLEEMERFDHTDMLLRLYREVVQASVASGEPQPSAADIAVGTRVINFTAQEGVPQFEEGEVTETRQHGPLPQLVVTWDSSGMTTIVNAGQLNQQFAAFRMRERVVQAIRVGRKPDLSDAEKEDRMRAVLQGILREDDDTGPSLEAQLSEVVLTQSDVARVLIPRMKSQWQSLFSSVKDMTISTKQLRQQFQKLDRLDACKREVELLSITGTGQINDDSLVLIQPTGAGWIDAVLEKLSEFLLLENLNRWIPSILHAHTLMESLCSVKVEDDTLVGKLTDVYSNVQEQWAEKSLATVSDLVAPIKNLFSGFSNEQLDFFAKLQDSDELMIWLLAHKENDKFTSLLQVCRPCVDNELLLGAIASLVQVRTVMLDMLYLSPPYRNLEELLQAVKKVDMGRRRATIQHLENVQQSFEGLLEVFEKQTRSPGIKSCYDLNEIRLSGKFVLTACGDKEQVLKLHLSVAKTEAVVGVAGLEPEPEDAAVGRAATGDGPVRIEEYEYMQDLRSKLIMTELPPEIEAEMPIKEMIESFVDQLQTLSDMRDALHRLFTSGHFSYQGGYTRSHRFQLGGLASLRESLADLENSISQWEAVQREMRTRHFFLNFFTMRELLRVAGLLQMASAEGIGQLESAEAVQQAMTAVIETRTDTADTPAADPDAATVSAAEEDAGAALTLTKSVEGFKSQIEQVQAVMGPDFPAALCIQAIRMTKGNAERAVNLCLSGAVDMSSRTAVVREPGSGSASSPVEVKLNPLATVVNEFCSMLCLVSSDLPEGKAIEAMRWWARKAIAAVPDASAASTNDSDAMSQAMVGLAAAAPAELLQALGELLDQIFETDIPGCTSLSEPETELEPEPESVSNIYREISKPGKDAVNRADYLITGEEFRKLPDVTKRLPVWVTCAQSPKHVIDVVMSVFVRRGRLPEPSEILFCTSDTTLEEIELLVRRFLKGREHNRGEYIFTLADVHSLSYTKQCAVVDQLQSAIAEHGTQEAATLLIVSGRRRQVILNSLSQQSVNLPPLRDSELRRACTEAFQRHCGHTRAVTGNINGCGKSFHIMSYVAQQQVTDSSLLYRRLPFREASSASSMVEHLSRMKSSKNAVHLDIGHIIPASANTVLFELLIIGVIRDKDSCRVYHRSQSDTFLLEIPNSIGDKTAEALRISSFLPSEHVTCEPEALALEQPLFEAGSNCTRLTKREFTALTYVGKYLRAMSNHVLEYRTEHYKLDYDPLEDAEEIDGPKVFELLREYTAGNEDTDAMLPSFNTMMSFVRFMFPMMQKTCQWSIMSWQLEDLAPLWQHNFKHSFVKMLIATSKDFSTRSVAQGDQTRAEVIDDGQGDEDDGAPLARQKSGSAGSAGNLARTSSARSDETHAMQEGALDGGAAPLVRLRREDSREGANRFKSMTSWENSDHPVAVWQMSPDGYSVDGINILSLNPRFVDAYIRRDLKQALGPGGVCYPPLDFNRNWSKLTNAEAMEMLRHASGWGGQVAAQLDQRYVMTVDNLLKMLSIALRIRNGMPVIVMGETGCGKSSLMTGMCAILGWRLHTLNIHGGMEDSDVIEWMNHVIDSVEASGASGDTPHVAFLDEVNTCNSMGLFKEMLCDGYMNGRRIPDSIKVIAACNPYRLRQHRDGDEEGVGLVFEHDSSSPDDAENVGTGIKDPLSELVYRVHPLPESMTDYIFDFGALSQETEEMYIKAMIRNNLSLYVTEEEMVEEMGREEQLLQMAQEQGIPAALIEGMSREELMEVLTQRQRAAARAEYERRAAAGEEVGQEFNQWGYAKAHNKFGEFVETFTELVCAAQEFVREFHGGERSSASLRDVARCIKVYRWFGEHFAERQRTWSKADFFSAQPAARPHIRSALFMSLAYCYHSRLPRSERKMLRMKIAEKWRSMQVPATRTATGWTIPGKDYCTWLNLTPSSFEEVLQEVQKSFVSNMKFPKGIALNEALCENVFMILVSVLNQIPIFIIGKPGTSKSLAVELIQTNLQGKASENNFLRALPAVQTFSYQCSPLSTSEGIEQAFASARRYKMEAANTVVIVLLDEVGLAEQSPHLPLKVLHKTLDEAGSNESVVGISNWALDPAKMNRAVHLYRQEPTVEDLALTAEGMVDTANLRGHLIGVARSFSEVYRLQGQTDFWGMREFYSTVRFINRALDNGAKHLSPDILMTAVLRNYGGRPTETDGVVSRFFREMGMMESGATRPPVLNLVRQNIREPEARHLMLLTRNNAALGLLFDHGILAHDRTTVLFGSDFPLDKSDLQVCLNIQRVKHCMASGVTLVLLHCESLFESMYDLLNQHYTTVGGQLWVRLAFGTHSRLCPIDPNFRVIVVVEKQDAYTKLAAPLLNRFEKQVMERKDVMTSLHMRVAQRLKRFAETLAARESTKAAHDDGSDDENDDELGDFTNVADMQVAMCGFHSDILYSLTLTVVAEAEDGQDWYGDAPAGSPLDLDKIYQEAVFRLMWVATPEAVCRVARNDAQRKVLLEQRQVDVPDLYFSRQSHSNLPAYMDCMRKKRKPGKPHQTLLMTYSPLFLGAADVLSSQQTWSFVSLCVLHDLSSERDLEQHIQSFFDTAESGSLLLVQCDPRAASLRRVEHAKYMCEKALADFMNGNGKQFFKEGSDAQLEPEPEMDEPQPEPEPDGKPAAIETRHKTLDVIVLVHLPRASDLNFCVDFDSRWAYGFVDNVLPASQQGLLDVEEMIGRSMTEIIEKIELSTVLAANFRLAVARLVYLYERSNDDVRDQIGVLLGCLQNALFVDLIRERMLEMVDSFKLSLDLSDLADADESLALAGTFQEALHNQITDALAGMFALVLSHMDRNGGLSLFADAPMQDIWCYLFSKTFEDLKLIDVHESKRTIVMGARPKPIEVPSDGLDRKPFQAKFPFSFYLSKALESMRETSLSIAAGGDTQASLQSQFEKMSLDHGLSEVLPEAMLRFYVHDMACMHMLNSEVPNWKTTQSQVLWRILELHAPEKPIQRLSDIHSRYWACEQRLALYSQLLDAVPAAIAPVLEKLENSLADLLTQTSTDVGSVAVDVAVMQKVLGFLQLEVDTNYGQWCTQMDLAKPAVLSLLSRVYVETDRDHPSVKSTRLQWEKLELYDHFIRNIIPVVKQPAVTMEMVDALTPLDLRTQTAFRALVSLLCKTVVGIAVTDSQKEESVRKLTSRMMELYTFEVVFSKNEDTSSGLPLELLSDFVQLVAGRDLSGVAMQGIRDSYGYLIPSEAGRVALLSAVTHANGSAQLRQEICTQISGQLEASVQAQGFLDSSFCLSFLAVLENDMHSEIASQEAIDNLAGKIDLSLLNGEQVPVRDKLQCVAAVRQLLLTYARQLSHCVEPQEGVAISPASTSLLALLQSAVDPLLVANASGELSGPLRSMRMFLLKAMERQRGVQFVRSACMQEPLRSSPWLKAWIADEETGLVRFMGQNKLPQHNPMKKQALFQPAAEACASFLMTGATSTIETFVGQHAEDGSKVKAALATALFHEVGLLKVLPSGISAETAAKLEALLTWLRTSASLNLEPAERQLLVFCAGGSLEASSGSKDCVDYLTLDKQSSPEKIAIVRLLVHLSASAMAAENGSQLHFMRRLLFNPEELKDNFWPTMPDDPLHMAMQALMAAGADRGANRWFTCPNGHPFAIGQCGGAMEEARCPECGEKIGGRDHTLVSTNKVIGKTEGGDDKALFKKTIAEDKSDKNYCLRTAPEEADKHYSCRALDSKSTRTLRIMMHGIMAVAHAVGGESWWMKMCISINQSYTKTEDVANPSAFILAHLRQDVNILKELLDKNDDELMLLLHKSILVADGSDLDTADDEDEEGTEAPARSDAPAPETVVAVHPAPNTINVAVVLAPDYANHSDAAGGPLSPGEIGNIIEYGGMTGRRFNVRAPAGGTWWYDAEALLTGDNAATQASRVGTGGHPAEGPHNVGLRVVLAPDFQTHSDAAGGPLQPGDVGEIIEFRARNTHQWRVIPPGVSRDAGRDWWYDTAALLVYGKTAERASVPDTLLESPSRVKWEGSFHTDCLGDLLDDEGLSERLRGLESEYSGYDEGSLFKAELLERYELADRDPAERKLEQPGLWLYKRPFSFDHFASSLTRNEALPEQFPVLSAFLEKSAELESLRYLPQFFTWLGLLMERYDKRLEREVARKLTVSEVLDDVPLLLRDKWQKAFGGFKSAWDRSWHSVGRHGCLKIPRDFLSLRQDGGTFISFSLPGPSDEGICPNALADYLIRVQNDFVARVDQVLLMRGLDVQRHSTRKNEISSRHMTIVHSLVFDTQQEFVPYVSKHCVHYGAAGSGDIVYDFEAAEKFLIERYFYNKPLINLALPGFSYADDVQATARTSLKDKVAQERIPRELETTIKREFTTPAAAQLVLRRLETCINFLNATGGSFVERLGDEVGEMGLSSYLADDLLMDEREVAAFGLAIRQQIKLKHLEALWDLLQSLTDVDVFAEVLEEYRQELSPLAAARLAEATPQLDLNILLIALKNFILTQLTRPGTAASDALKNALAWTTHDGEFLSDYEWFEDHFPQVEGLTIGTSLASLRVLEKLHKAAA